MSDLFTQSVSPTLVLGIGSMGADVAVAGAFEESSSDDLPLACWAAAHIDIACLIATGLDKKLVLNPGPVLSGPFAERGIARSITASDAEIRGLTAGRNAIVLCGSLGESAGALLMPALAHNLKSRGILVCAIVAGAPHDADGIAADTCFSIPFDLKNEVDPHQSWESEMQAKLLLATQSAVRALAGAAENGVSSHAGLKTHTEVLIRAGLSI